MRTTKQIISLLLISLLLGVSSCKKDTVDNNPQDNEDNNNTECMAYVDLHGQGVYEAHDMFFINAQEGWLAGTSGSGNNILLHTTDGGHNWSIINESPSVSNGGFSFDNLYFVDNHLGYAFKFVDERIYTTDGGVTWTEIPSPTVADGEIMGITAGLGVNNNYMVFTATIDPSDSNLPPYEKMFFFSNTTHDYVNGEILPSGHTFNQGRNGIPIYYSNSGVINMDIYENGERAMAHSSDNGANWTFTNVDIEDFLLDINFPTENVGYIPAKVIQYTSTVPFYKTTDGGASWTLLSADLGNNGAGFDKISFADENNGLAIRGLGKSLYKTSDGGTTWQRVGCFTDTDSQLDIVTTPIEIYYPSENKGIILTIWQNPNSSSDQDLYQNRIYFYTN